MTYNPTLCNERHQRIDTRLGQNEEKIAAMALAVSETKGIVSQLCAKMDALMGMIKWLIVTLFLMFSGFFVWAVQQAVKGVFTGG